MSRYSVVRLLETFFRRWWLYLVPFVLLCALGAASVVSAPPKYRSIGTVTVNRAVLDSSTGTDPFGYDSPAVYTAKSVNSQLKTEVFLTDIAGRARLSELVAQNVITLTQIQSSIAAYADGTNLLKVSAVFDDPAVAQLLVQATIEAYTQSIIDVSTGDSLAAANFYEGLISAYEADVTRARDALDTYLREHPQGGFGVTRPDDEAAQISRLQADASAADTKYQSALGKAEEARLKTEVTKAEVGRRYILTDAPKLPVSPVASKKTMAMQIAVFAVIGALLALTAVVVAATFDHSVRFASDLRDRMGLRVLAVVPRSRELAHEGTRRARAERKRRSGADDQAPTRDRIVARAVPPRVAPAARAAASAMPAPPAAMAAPASDAPVHAERPPARERPIDTRPAAAAPRDAARPEPYYAPEPTAPRPARPTAGERPAMAPRRERPAERPAASTRPAPAPAPASAQAERGWSAGRRPRPEPAAGAPAANGNGDGHEGAADNGNGDRSGWPQRRRGGGRPGDIPHAS